MKMKMHMIQSVSIVNWIQIKLMKVIDNMNNILNQEFQRYLELQLSMILKFLIPSTSQHPVNPISGTPFLWNGTRFTCTFFAHKLVRVVAAAFQYPIEAAVFIRFAIADFQYSIEAAGFIRFTILKFRLLNSSVPRIRELKKKKIHHSPAPQTTASPVHTLPSPA
jgi:hypothetical protein